MTEFNPHVLVVKHTIFPPDLPGEDEFVEVEYDLSCPGVTDHCRRYEPCEVPGCKDDGRGVSVVGHDVQHLWIDGEWMAATDRCLYVDHDGMPEAAEYLNLPAGLHLVDVDYRGDDEIDLIVLEPAK